MGMLILFFGNVLFNVAMAGIMISMNDSLAESGIQGTESLSVMAGMFSLDYIYFSALVPIVVIVLILLTGAAGGEQKKRSIIIPQIAGLSPVGYVLPKFLLYPPMIFVLTIIAAFAANSGCHAILAESYSFGTVLLTGSLVGVYAVFLVSMYLFLGISLTQPGLSVIYVFVADMFFSSMLIIVFDVDRFTPWNLTGFANDALFGQVDTAGIAVTVAVTLVFSVIFMLLTLFSIVAKRMDNSYDEVY